MNKRPAILRDSQHNANNSNGLSKFESKIIQKLLAKLNKC